MSQALYRKYRSKKLDEIVGQPAVTMALKNALKNSQISHAYLFTGPRGIGKTSVARILAHEVNGLSYTSDDMPIDIIEIDAASNRRIDEIRDLREKVNIAPVSAKYKVYIIDEVHMLTKEAFNALLKTLEEPPEHVIFILATTEAHKLPETIISRTQRYNFKLASQKDVSDHLKSIAKKENIKIDDESIDIIAKHSGGSLRDAISILDQIQHSASDIKAQQVMQNIGLPSETIIDNIIDAFISNEPKQLIDRLSEAFNEGISANLLANQLIDYCRSELMHNPSKLPSDVVIKLIEDLLVVESSSKPDIQLEIVLISNQASGQEKPKTIVSESHIENAGPPLTISMPASILAKHTKINKNQDKEKPDTSSLKHNNQLDMESWLNVLAKISQKHNAIYGILRTADVDFSEISQNELGLNFRFPFHQKRMNESRNKKIILNILKENGFKSININCKLIEHKSDTVGPDNTEDFNRLPGTSDKAIPVNIDKLKSIFGNAEVLE